MKRGIEPSIIDGNVEKEGLYTDTTINTLQERLDTINFQLDSINMQLNEDDVSVSINEKARLLTEKRKMENERAEVEHKIAELKEQEKEKDEEFDLESAETFKGSLEKDKEELYSTRKIGKAYVPKSLTTIKKETREVEEDIIKSAKQINEEYKKKAEDTMSKMDNLFR